MEVDMLLLDTSQESERRLCFDGEVYDPTTNTCSGIENVWPYLDSGGRGRIAGDIRGSSRLWCFINSKLQSKRQWVTEDDKKNGNLSLKLYNF
ncbi:hypothetical protein BRARA_C00611 [Brassica rapa]|uniref:Uncharacterized protein n=1 Tax=Brassica campestris TaxID=3711 RepID=A0A397ZZY3_BRACM|nr:hypothetical protein BRARA_C00611 [Brassica rapa]